MRVRIWVVEATDSRGATMWRHVFDNEDYAIQARQQGKETGLEVTMWEM